MHLLQPHLSQILQSPFPGSRYWFEDKIGSLILVTAFADKPTLAIISSECSVSPHEAMLNFHSGKPTILVIAYIMSLVLLTPIRNSTGCHKQASCFVQIGLILHRDVDDQLTLATRSTSANFSLSDFPSFLRHRDCKGNHLRHDCPRINRRSCASQNLATLL